MWNTQTRDVSRWLRWPVGLMDLPVSSAAPEIAGIEPLTSRPSLSQPAGALTHEFCLTNQTHSCECRSCRLSRPPLCGHDCRRYRPLSDIGLQKVQGPVRPVTAKVQAPLRHKDEHLVLAFPADFPNHPHFFGQIRIDTRECTGQQTDHYRIIFHRNVT